MAIKNCVQCGAEFDAFPRQKQVCSEFCRKARCADNTRRHREKMGDAFLEAHRHQMAEWRKNNPARGKEIQRRYDEKVKNDPSKYIQKKELERKRLRSMKAEDRERARLRRRECYHLHPRRKKSTEQLRKQAEKYRTLYNSDPEYRERVNARRRFLYKTKMKESQEYRKYHYNRTKQWAYNNPDRVKEYIRKCYDKHIEVRRSRARLYEKEYRKRKPEVTNLWRLRNPDKVLKHQKRRAAKVIRLRLAKERMLIHEHARASGHNV